MWCPPSCTCVMAIVPGRRAWLVLLYAATAIAIDNEHILFRQHNYLGQRRNALQQDTASTTSDLHRVEVGVISSPSHGANWARFFANSNGWHARFRSHLRAYTFDVVDPASPIASVFDTVPMLGELAGERSARDSNLHLAALGSMHARNPRADWYLEVEDDTLVVASNLRRLLARLDPSRPLMLGKCVHYEHRNATDDVHFAVGGAGVLISGTLLRRLAPRIPECRRRFGAGGDNWLYSDARVGACAARALGADMPHEEWLCAQVGQWDKSGTVPTYRSYSPAFIFSNRNLLLEAKEQDPRNFVVTLHVKDPGRIRRITAWVRAQEAAGAAITWGALAPVLRRMACVGEAGADKEENLTGGGGARSCCPPECRKCRPGGDRDGLPLGAVSGVCEAWCSRGGFCGKQATYAPGGGVYCGGCPHLHDQ